ncbi:MAG: GNAT family N-acetyltransferase [Acidimicrobiaceae bacterium]|nr:GNAT family N-acetyltransferase [Acidimicrobiaceae bacterium]
MSLHVRPLDASTWDVFADLVERHNGICGGCWCISYHLECGRRDLDNRTVKEERFKTGRAHAALVLGDCGVALGWCPYGSPVELSKLKNRREYDKKPPLVPDWRITCIFVVSDQRGQGVARAALSGALDLIAQAGGGPTEAIGEVTIGRAAQGRFIFSANVELFEQYGFQRQRQVGRQAWIICRTVNANSIF